MGRPPIRRVLGRIAIAAGVALALFGIASFYVEVRYAARIVAAADAPPQPVALVFGAGLTRTEPSPLLAERLDMAVALYRQGKVKQILVSGDNSDRYHDETEAMRQYLFDQGIARSDVLGDDLGLSTYDSCVRAVQKFKVSRALLVTQRFHLSRALYIANSVGVDAYGVAADHDPTRYSTYVLRELLSRPLALAMVITRPEPAGSATK